MTNLASILKSRAITLATKVHVVKAMVFPVVMYECENWTIRRLNAKELMLSNCGAGKLLRVSCIARRSNQSILKEINREYSLKGCMLKFKLQYFGHLMWRADSLEKTLILGKLEGRRRGWQRMSWLDSITNSMDWVWASSGRWWRTGKPGVQANRVLPIERTDHSKQPSSSNTRDSSTHDGQYWNKSDYILCRQR